MPLDVTHTTRLLQRISAGDARAGDELLPLLYQELKSVAAACMDRERPNHTLQPTALVHEAWMRVIGAREGPTWSGRDHFVRAAACAMRHVLVDHARARAAQKRGNGGRVLPLDSVMASFEERQLDVLALDEALERLTAMDEQLGRIVELRFFAGLTIPETARVLGVSTPTVERGWRVARLWLRNELPPA